MKKEIAVDLSLQEQLFQLEKGLLEPEIRKSAAKLETFLADDFIEFGSSGGIYNKQQVIEQLPHVAISSMKMLDFQVKYLAPDVVLTMFRIVQNSEPEKETSQSVCSSIWRFEQEQWQIIFHQGTPVREA